MATGGGTNGRRSAMSRRPAGALARGTHRGAARDRPRRGRRGADGRELSNATRIAPPAAALVVRAVDLEPARALGDAAHPTHRLHPPLPVARVQGEPAIELEILVARDR